VVGGDVGGIRLQVVEGETGFLLQSVTECADATVRLLRDPDLRDRMGAAGRERVRERFLVTRELEDQVRLMAGFA
jgi:trehalose synthase